MKARHEKHVMNKASWSRIGSVMNVRVMGLLHVQLLCTCSSRKYSATEVTCTVTFIHVLYGHLDNSYWESLNLACCCLSSVPNITFTMNKACS